MDPSQIKPQFELNPGSRWVTDGSGGWLAVGGSPLSLLMLDLEDADTTRTAKPGRRVQNCNPKQLDRLIRRGVIRPLSDGTEISTGADDCTVIVPFFGDPSRLRRCIGDIRSAYPSIPIILVDDCSGHPDLVEQISIDFGATLTRAQSNGGPARARNLGASLATTRHLIFIDSDVSISAGTLEALSSWLGLSSISAVAPRIRSGSDRANRTRYATSSAARPSLDMGPSPFVIAKQDRSEEDSSRYVPSAVLMVKAETFALVGGFNEEMRFGEDVDLIWRVSESGGVVVYDPHVSAHHDRATSLLANMHKEYNYGGSLPALGIKWPRRVKAIEGDPLLLLVYLLAPIASWVGALLVWLIPTLTFLIRTTKSFGEWRFGIRARSILASYILGQSISGTDSFYLRTFGWLLLPISPFSRRIRSFLVMLIVMRGVRMIASEQPGLNLSVDLAGTLLADMAYGVGVSVASLQLKNFAGFRIRLRRSASLPAKRGPMDTKRHPKK